MFKKKNRNETMHIEKIYINRIGEWLDKDKVPAIIVDYKTKGDVKIDTFEFKVIETYGHTMDSVSFYFDKNDILFTGDFVFKETIGNFEEDNEQAMINSLKVFKYMSVNVRIYPGHDEETTVEHEIKYNPFLRGI